MSDLTSKDRKGLPSSSFGMPEARASQQEAKGKLSPSSKTKIDAKANKMLGKGNGDKK